MHVAASPSPPDCLDASGFIVHHMNAFPKRRSDLSQPPRGKPRAAQVFLHPLKGLAKPGLGTLKPSSGSCSDATGCQVLVPGTGIEPVRPLCRIAADFKSAVSTNSTTRAKRTTQLPPGTADAIDHFWRRDPESNRANRICNPVHNRFAIAPVFLAVCRCCAPGTAPTKKGSLGFPFYGMWSGKRVSNSRPQPWQGCALPTELFPRFKPRSI